MFFSRNKKQAASNFILKLINNNCTDVLQLQDGPRSESRVNLSVVVLVIPVVSKKKVDPTKAFHAVTKDFSSSSVSVTVDSPRPIGDAIIAFRYEGEMHYAYAKARHTTPIGGGFYQIGFQLNEMIQPLDYEGLSHLSF
jgi:hypothetical protein